MSTTRSASSASASTTDLESADLLPHPGSSGVTSISIFKNASAQELIHSGNAAYKELLHSNIQSQKEYTNLVRGYLRVTEYCQYIVGLYADLSLTLSNLHYERHISTTINSFFASRPNSSGLYEVRDDPGMIIAARETYSLCRQADLAQFVYQINGALIGSDQLIARFKAHCPRRAFVVYIYPWVTVLGAYPWVVVGGTHTLLQPASQPNPPHAPNAPFPAIPPVRLSRLPPSDHGSCGPLSVQAFCGPLFPLPLPSVTGS
ncbi:hypothetical protein FB45DRAFT_1008683 [Roridomyces roridus]|uniref:Uncharacterized protein n=1 Tax=Roridomyces roridus TaxID=1738132 RepID=A0AAD7FDY1_9AGAR|nr:hypothetical protein FB45DRAFT_1008683 [Roridomyces roridus]